MNLLKTGSCLAVFVVAFVLLSVNSAADVQVLTENELSSFVGGCLCKGSSTSHSCTSCVRTGVNTSKCCDTGSTSIKKCISGLPDGCTMSGSVSCGERTYYWDDNEDCLGFHSSSSAGCSVKTASGNPCE